MIGVNCVVFVFLVFVDAAGLKHLIHEMSNLRMMWSDGWLLELHAPVSGSFHVYFSHDALSESTVKMLSIRLQKLVPTAEIFIHMDGMKDGSMLETNVVESDLFVAMITDNYLGYASCRRELVTALHHKKQMLLLLDAGTKTGATRPMNASLLRVQLSLMDEEAYCTQKEHNAAERLIKVIESGSMEHLKKKDLADLLALLQVPCPDLSSVVQLRVTRTRCTRTVVSCMPFVTLTTRPHHADVEESRQGDPEAADDVPRRRRAEQVDGPHDAGVRYARLGPRAEGGGQQRQVGPVREAAPGQAFAYLAHQV